MNRWMKIALTLIVSACLTCCRQPEPKKSEAEIVDSIARRIRDSIDNAATGSKSEDSLRKWYFLQLAELDSITGSTNQLNPAIMDTIKRRRARLAQVLDSFEKVNHHPLIK
jgi:hypothetical protein